MRYVWTQWCWSLSSQGVLRIHFLEAQELLAKDMFLGGIIKGKSDPYGVLHIDNQLFRSKVIKKTINPKWNEVYEVENILKCPQGGSRSVLRMILMSAVWERMSYWRNWMGLFYNVGVGGMSDIRYLQYITNMLSCMQPRRSNCHHACVNVTFRLWCMKTQDHRTWR